MAIWGPMYKLDRKARYRTNRQRIGGTQTSKRSPFEDRIDPALTEVDNGAKALITIKSSTNWYYIGANQLFTELVQHLSLPP
jgi:hypothetical protein